MRTISKLILAPLLLMVVPVVNALEIKGVTIPETATIPTVDRDLVLNGAGVRKKFFVSVYVGALYLTEKSAVVEEIVKREQPKRVAMHFLYDKVEAEKLRDAWREGIESNVSEAEFGRLADRLEKFNALFGDAVKGDTIFLDYLPSIGTRVTINSEVKGTVLGGDFNRALLKVWLGERPVTESLKAGMLGK